MNDALRIRRHNGLAQVVVVALISGSLVLAADAFGFRSPANFLWLVALPVTLGVVLNSGWVRRGLMALALVGVSALSAIAIGVAFTSYG